MTLEQEYSLVTRMIVDTERAISKATKGKWWLMEELSELYMDRSLIEAKLNRRVKVKNK